MAGERTLPGLGLTGYWDLGDNTWKTGMDTNLLVLSVLGSGAIDSRAATEPGSPTDGDIVIATADWGGGEAVNSIQVRDNGAWVELVPVEGWAMRDAATNENLIYDGSAWAVIEAGGGGGGGGTDFNVRKEWVGCRKGIPTFNASPTNAFTDVTMSAAATDPYGFDGTNEFVIPAGVRKVRVSYFVRGNGSEADNQWVVRKNNALIAITDGAAIGEVAEQAFTNGGEFLSTGVLDCVEGDTFNLEYYLASATPDYDGWFEIEAIDHDLGAGSGPVLPFRGIRVKSAADISIAANTGTVVNNDTVEFSAGGWTLNGTDDVVVPDGTTHVCVSAHFQVDVSPGAAEYEFSIRVNSTTIVYQRTSNAGWGGASITTGPIAVEPGDLIDMTLWSTDALTLRHERTALSVHDISFSAGVPTVIVSEETAAFSVTETHLGGNQYVEVNNASALDITVPPDLVNTQPVTFEMTGAGVPTFVAGAGVTINSFGDLLDIAGTSGVVTLMPKGSNVYTLFGNLA